MADIKTKFEIGERLWTIKDEKAHMFDVTSIFVTISENDETQSVMDKNYKTFSIDKCFRTKEELIDYIFGDGEKE